MAITEVTMFKTSKGELCKTKEGAELAEKLDNMEIKLEKLIGNEICYSSEQSIVHRFVMANRVELLEILA